MIKMSYINAMYLCYVFTTLSHNLLLVSGFLGPNDSSLHNCDTSLLIAIMTRLRIGLLVSRKATQRISQD